MQQHYKVSGIRLKTISSYWQGGGVNEDCK